MFVVHFYWSFVSVHRNRLRIVVETYPKCIDPLFLCIVLVGMKAMIHNAHVQGFEHGRGLLMGRPSLKETVQ